MRYPALLTAARRAFVAGALVLLLGCPLLAGSNFKVLYSFKYGDDGAGPHAGLVMDAAGNLYGTTGGGGIYSGGTVFELSRQPDGSWEESVLHDFNPNVDGEYPDAGLIVDSGGNLYGATHTGDADHQGGTVFQLVPGPDGWTETVLYTFCAQPHCADGGAAHGLLLDKSGNVYGTTQGGGAPSNGGVVFKLTPGGDGTWTETLLHVFDIEGQSHDGSTPLANLVWDAAGNLYSTTWFGGKFNFGTVFKLKPQRDGSWVEHRLHDFGSFADDGQAPGYGLIFDANGDLYGTTSGGGSHKCGSGHCGTVFQMTRQPDGHWKERVLHNFASGKSGFYPSSGVVFDGSGNLYGTTGLGGADACSCGVVYKLASGPNGTWTYSVLHRFKGWDGYQPRGGLILGKNGHLYGTAIVGGAEDDGVVFEITP